MEITGFNALLKYPILRSNGWTNLACSRGTIIFWFMPQWNSGTGANGPGTYGRLIDVGEYTPDASHGWWSLYLDPHGTNLSFSAQTNGAGATYLSAPVQWTSNEWHFIALTYSQTNSALYLDGQLLTHGSGVTYWPGADVLSASGFTLGSDANGTNVARGQFEVLVTFDYQLSPEFVAAYYNFVVQLFPGQFGDSFLQSSFNSTFTALESFNNGSSGNLIGLEACGVNSLMFLHPTPQGTNALIRFYPGGQSNQFDLFYSTNLVTWTNVARSTAGQTNFSFALSAPTSFFLLGTMQDVDTDGQTDAYELLIGHTDPWPNLVPLQVFFSQPLSYPTVP